MTNGNDDYAGWNNHRSYIDRLQDETLCPAFSKITDSLFLGRAPEARDLDTLQRLGIKNILSVAKECHDEWIGYTHREFNVIYAGMRDHEPLPPLIAKLAITSLKEMLKKGKTLVHCGIGVSRSPTIISLYWLALGQVDSYEEGIQKLQVLRPVVRPNKIVDHNLLQMVASLRKNWSRRGSETPVAAN